MIIHTKYHHVSASRDDGMDEQEIHWHFGQPDEGFWLRRLYLKLIFVHIPPTNPTQLTSMGQMTPKQPLIIIIWVHQEMMAWMSRNSIGILDSLMKDFGSDVAVPQADFCSHPTHQSNPADLHGPDDAQTTTDGCIKR
jgi:hypothetical protein